MGNKGLLLLHIALAIIKTIAYYHYVYILRLVFLYINYTYYSMRPRNIQNIQLKRNLRRYLLTGGVMGKVLSWYAKGLRFETPPIRCNN